ncbi:MAG: transposase [Sulfuricella sp.]|nr:transposase [Sulfuricella sp.]
MTRPLRLEFPGAIYHVTARGNARAAIFLDDEDRSLFLAVLSECVKRFGWLGHAYCLMDNHYHLLLETPAANLSEGMRHLNGIYTQRFNRRHARVGHVFQGRFKAILVDRESYLLELCRYVVLNPVRAGMVTEAAQYAWSSYLATLGAAPVPSWLHTDWLLGQFGKNRTSARRKYEEFVAGGMGNQPPWGELKGQILLGSEQFVNDLQPLIADKTGHREFSRGQRLVNRPSLISLFPDQVRMDKPLRDEAIRRAFMECGYSMADIARASGMHYSTVSRVIKGER